MTDIITIQNVHAYLDAQGTAWLNAADVNGRTFSYLAWTQRGRYFLYHFLKERGLVPISERLQKGA